MATEKGKQSTILWLFLIGGVGFYFWRKQKKTEAQMRRMARQSGAEELGGQGGAMGGGGLTPIIPRFGSSTDGTDINVSVDTGDDTPDAPPPQSVPFCIKNPTDPRCVGVIDDPILADDPSDLTPADPIGMGTGTGTGTTGQAGTTGTTGSPAGTTGSTGSTGTTSGASNANVGMGTTGGVATGGSTPAPASTMGANPAGMTNFGGRWDFDGEFGDSNNNTRLDFDGEM